MLPNLKICENGWSNFSENLRIVALKLLELTRFLLPNISIYFYFVGYWGSVVTEGDFFVNSPFIDISNVEYYYDLKLRLICVIFISKKKL